MAKDSGQFRGQTQCPESQIPSLTPVLAPLRGWTSQPPFPAQHRIMKPILHDPLLPVALQLATVAAACFGSLQALETTTLSPGHTALGASGARGADSLQFSLQHREPLLLANSCSPFRTQAVCHPVWAVTAVQEPAGLNEEGQVVAPAPQAAVQSSGSFSCGRNIASLPRSGPVLGRFSSSY